MNDQTGRRPPRNWPALLMFAITLGIALTLVPWYGIAHGYTLAAWVSFAVLLSANELAITCGYHRLFAHTTYRRVRRSSSFICCSAQWRCKTARFVWAAGHRVHHRYIDDPMRDPYCARRGFWFSHIGWMLRNYPSGDPDFSTVRDLQRDPLVMWQHRHYLPLALAMNIGVPLLLGWAVGDIAGVFLLGGVLRLVVSHHLTFCINSLAHIVGVQPYTDEQHRARQRRVALLTFGEGYHNFHHSLRTITATACAGGSGIPPSG